MSNVGRSLSVENKLYLEELEERVELCHCGRVAMRYDNECRTCRMHPSCRCQNPLWDSTYMGQRFDRKCRKLEAA